MARNSISSLLRPGLLMLAICGGWAGGHLWSLESPAQAGVTPALTPLDRLLIEDDIRQKIVLYGLLADGDGMGGRKRDLRTLADTMMTPDVVSEIHPANGSAPIILNGRDVVANTPPDVDPDRARRIAGRHYLVGTFFDSVTPTTVETRTTAVFFDATKNLVGPKCKPATDGDCGGTPARTFMWIYQMSWKKTPQGWQISRNILRDDN